MPSVKNPNTVGRNRALAQRAAARKRTQQALKSAALPDRVAKADARRGARGGTLGLAPTSGPNAPLSKKKARKVEKAMAHAIRRRREEEERKEKEERGEFVFSFLYADHLDRVGGVKAGGEGREGKWQRLSKNGPLT